jgi:hypothetical protein
MSPAWFGLCEKAESDKRQKVDPDVDHTRSVHWPSRWPQSNTPISHTLTTYTDQSFVRYIPNNLPNPATLPASALHDPGAQEKLRERLLDGWQHIKRRVTPDSTRDWSVYTGEGAWVRRPGAGGSPWGMGWREQLAEACGPATRAGLAGIAFLAFKMGESKDNNEGKHLQHIALAYLHAARVSAEGPRTTRTHVVHGLLGSHSTRRTNLPTLCHSLRASWSTAIRSGRGRASASSSGPQVRDLLPSPPLLPPGPPPHAPDPSSKHSLST